MKANVAPFVVTVTLFLFLLNSTSGQNLGDPCGPNDYCRPSSGLICDEGHCACSNGNLTGDLSYQLQWDSELLKCVAIADSVCIGTKQHPLQPAVSCAKTLTCVQLENRALGHGICKSIPETFQHGRPCNENQYCDPHAGLICGNKNTCECSNGPLTDTLSYQLEWDSERGICVALPGTPCTASNIPFKAGSRSVLCKSGSCVQLEGHPTGVGSCEGNNEVTSSTPGSGPTENTGSTSSQTGNTGPSSTTSQTETTTENSATKIVSGNIFMTTVMVLIGTTCLSISYN